MKSRLNRHFTQAILDKMSQLGHVVFRDTSKDYNVNLIALRYGDGEVTNRFTDLFTCLIPRSDGTFEAYGWPCTTTPGRYWMLNPMNPGGTAIIAPGQYRGSHAIGMHNRTKQPPLKHEALVQVGPLRYFRDDNQDNVYDYDTSTIEEKNWQGLNIHRASAYNDSKTVDRWSAGCVVFSNPKDFAEFISFAKQAARNWGNSFSLTVIDAQNEPTLNHPQV